MAATSTTSRDASAPWLSVVLCTYQGERFLRATLDSLAGDDTQGIEIVAVDDGSTDTTLAILRRYESTLPLRLIPIPHTGNWVANTNLGLRAARGTYCCLLHQDDLWLPGRSAAVRAAIAAHPGIGVVAGPSLFIDETGRTVGHWCPPLPAGPRLTSAFVLERLIVQNFFALPSPVFRHDLALAVGPMDESLWFLADWKFWALLIDAGDLVCYPDPRTAFRIHPTSQTSSRTHDEADLRRQYESVIACIRGRLPDALAAGRAVDAARLNMDVSIALALWSHGRRRQALHAMGRGLRIAPTAWPRFLRDSRIIERVGARLRVTAAGRHARRPR